MREGLKDENPSVSREVFGWAMQGSNLRPLPCECSGGLSQGVGGGRFSSDFIGLRSGLPRSVLAQSTPTLLSRAQNGHTERRADHLAELARIDTLTRAALRLAGVIGVLALGACAPKVTAEEAAAHALYVNKVTDNCVRQAAFAECLKSVPQGPPITTFNDWAEVVEECGRQASRIAERQRSTVRPECVATP